MNIRTTILYLMAVTTAGCGTVTPEHIKASAQTMRERIAAQQEQAKSNVAERPLIEKIPGTYLSNATIPLAYTATLPQVFREAATMNFRARPGTSGKLNLATVAARITEATNLPVRIRPDVYISAKSLVRSANNAPATATAAQPTPSAPGMPSAFPTPMVGIQGASERAAVGTKLFADFEDNLPQEFDGGTWAQYLDTICAHLGINWEYKDGAIVLYRLQTKSFVLKINMGDTTFTSSVKKGGGSNPGSGGSNGGSAGGGGTGSFTSDTGSSVNANASVWRSLDTALNGMKTPLGNVTIDEAAGIVTVTDTKDSIEAIGRYVDVMNATLTRQIDLEVRVLRVAATESTSQGFDVNLIYSRLNSAGAAENVFGMSPASTLANSDAGRLSFGIISPTNRWAGSEILVQALREVGTIVGDDVKTATTTNRVPVSIAVFDSETYLAATTPAAGGGTAGGQGVPGLTPGTLTTGSILNVIPTAFENGSVLLRLAIDDTTSRGIGSITSGNGATFQQIQTPRYSGSKSDHSAGLKSGESLVLVGTSTDRTSGTNRNGVTGYSANGSRVRSIEIVVVTPRVRAGI